MRIITYLCHINLGQMKLVYRHIWGNETSSGEFVIPFEYESKEKFVFDLLERYKNHEWVFYPQRDYSKDRKRPTEYFDDNFTSSVEIFDYVELNKAELEEIEAYVYTLDEWFETQKKELKPNP